jgi:Predicted outer membrane protein
MKKRLLLLITIVATTLSLMASAFAAAPSTVTFQYRSLSGVNVQSGATSYYKTVKSGNSTIIGYCLNKSLKVPANGATVSYKSKITDAGLIYIYSNGFGGTWNTTLLGSGLTNDQRYYATQLAVWIYQGQLSTSGLNTNDAAVSAAIKLVNAAKSASTVAPSISISSASSNMTFDGTYYKSSLMTVKGSDFVNYTVTLVNASSYAEIVTTSGKVYSSGASLPAGTQFYVRIADSRVSTNMNISVRVSAVAKTVDVYKYSTNNSSYQDIGIAMASTTTVNGSTSIKLTKEVKPSQVSIIKRDADTRMPLAGATLVLKDASGRTVDTWISTTSAHTIKNLSAGTYYLSETKAPTGYLLTSKVITITLTAGDSKSIIMDNTKKEVEPSQLSILKRDATTGMPLAGATLMLKDANGKVMATWVSTTNPYVLKTLPAGTYYLSETKAPTGYVLSSRAIVITLVAGENKTVIFDNTPKETPKYDVNIIKKDSTTDKPLAGATLVLKDSNGNTIESWITTTNAHVIKDLTPGVYTVTETKAPTGYVLNSTPVKFTVVEGRTTTLTVSFYNTPEETKTTSVKISKQDITTQKELAGATLTLKDSNGTVVETWVSTNKPHYVKDLAPGRYTLIETKSPKGYGLSDEIIEFTVDKDGKVDKPVIMYNSPIPVTADINLVTIFIGFAGTIALGGFGMYKLSKQR